jgi:hypothetical protein
VRRLACALLAWLLPLAAAAQVIGLTFDDGLDPARTPKAEAWNTRILHALEQQQLHAIVFPSLHHIGGDAGLALIEQWAACRPRRGQPHRLAQEPVVGQGHAAGLHRRRAARRRRAASTSTAGCRCCAFRT